MQAANIFCAVNRTDKVIKFQFSTHNGPDGGHARIDAGKVLLCVLVGLPGHQAHSGWSSTRSARSSMTGRRPCIRSIGRGPEALDPHQRARFWTSVILSKVHTSFRMLAELALFGSHHRYLRSNPSLKCIPSNKSSLHLRLARLRCYPFLTLSIWFW